MNTEAQALPDFIRRPIEQAIHAAVNPIGMSVHDGMARVASDKLAYLLAAHDRLAAMAQPPAGWVIVPVEPTEAMLRADIERADWNGCDGTHRARAVYRAMLSAAPKPEDTK